MPRESRGSVPEPGETSVSGAETQPDARGQGDGKDRMARVGPTYIRGGTSDQANWLLNINESLNPVRGTTAVGATGLTCDSSYSRSCSIAELGCNATPPAALTVRPSHYWDKPSDIRAASADATIAFQARGPSEQERGVGRRAHTTTPSRRPLVGNIGSQYRMFVRM